jgi:hypothetical protein
MAVSDLCGGDPSLRAISSPYPAVRLLYRQQLQAVPRIMPDRTGNETVAAPDYGTTAKWTYDPQCTGIERSLYNVLDPNVQHDQSGATCKHGVRLFVDDRHFRYHRHFNVRDMIE